MSASAVKASPVIRCWTGGNAPNNLITLCKTCHEQYHKDELKLPKTIHRGMSFKNATFMGIMRWAFYEELKKRHSNVSMTYGYITKNTRIENKLLKTHCVDARCISGNPLAEPRGIYYLQKKIRNHNRQIHKAKILKGGRKKRNQAPYVVKGFRLYDKVLFGKQECFIQGRRKTGFFKLTKLDGTVIHQSAKSADLTLLEIRNTWPTEIQVQKGA
jgi:N6-L-threonylcarbamoyladenine synthase